MQHYVDIVTVNVDGTDLTQLTHESGQNTAPRWSPDGEWLLVRASRGTTPFNSRPFFYALKADGSEEVLLWEMVPVGPFQAFWVP